MPKGDLAACVLAIKPYSSLVRSQDQIEKARCSTSPLLSTHSRSVIRTKRTRSLDQLRLRTATSLRGSTPLSHLPSENVMGVFLVRFPAPRQRATPFQY